MAKKSKKGKSRDNYKIAEIELDQRKRGGAVFASKIVKSHLAGANLGFVTYVDIHGKNIIVYATSSCKVGDIGTITQSLTDLKQKQSEGGHQVGIKSVTFYDVFGGSGIDQAQHNLLQSELAAAQGDNKGLEAQVMSLTQGLEATQKSTQERIDAIRAEMARYKGQFASLQRQHGYLTTQLLIDNAAIDDLEQVLQKNRENWIVSQESVIESVFSLVAEEVEKRAYESEELKKARQTLADKKAYIAKFGEDAVKDLPKAARKATESEWSNAEKIIAKYKDRIQPMDLPVRIAKTDGRTVIVIPAKSKSENEVAEGLYEALITYGAIMQDEYKAEANQVENTYLVLELKGDIDFKNIEEKLTETLVDVTERAKINLKTFRTMFYLELEEKAEPEDQYKGMSLAEYVGQRIKESGQSRTGFAKANSITTTTLLRLLEGESKVQDKTIVNVAKALNVDVTELKKRYEQG